MPTLRDPSSCSADTLLQKYYSARCSCRINNSTIFASRLSSRGRRPPLVAGRRLQSRAHWHVRQHFARVTRTPRPLVHAAGPPGGGARGAGFEGVGRGPHSVTPHGMAKRAYPPGPGHLPRRCARRGRRPGSGLKGREQSTARGVTRAHGGTAGHRSESEAQALALNTDAVLGGQDGMPRALCGMMGNDHVPSGGSASRRLARRGWGGCAQRRQP